MNDLISGNVESKRQCFLTGLANENTLAICRYAYLFDGYHGIGKKQRGKASVSRPDQWESILSVGRSVTQSTWRAKKSPGTRVVLVARPENNRNDRCIARISWYRSPRTVSPYRFRRAVFFRRPASGYFDLLGPRDCGLTFTLETQTISREQIERRIKRFDIRKIVFLHIEHIYQYFACIDIIIKW